MNRRLIGMVVSALLMVCVLAPTPSFSQCTSTQTQASNGGPLTFQKFDPSVGDIGGIVIEFGATASARLDGRNDCTSCSNFKAILCGYHDVTWPGIIRWRENFLFCNRFSAARNQVVAVAVGGGTFGTRYTVPSGDWHFFVGTGQFPVTTQLLAGDYIPCDNGSSCPTVPLPGFPPCMDFGNMNCFSRAWTITQSIVVTVTYTYAARPTIGSQPTGTSTCPLGVAAFTVGASGSGTLAYQWEFENPSSPNDWADAPNGPSVPQRLTFINPRSPNLTVVAGIGGVATNARSIRVRCRVTATCGTTTSLPATMSVCVADMDDGSRTGRCDGGVTVDDLLYYLVQYAAGTLRADVDDGSGLGHPDSGVTVDDLLYYLSRYAAGC